MAEERAPARRPPVRRGHAAALRFPKGEGQEGDHWRMIVPKLQDIYLRAPDETTREGAPNLDDRLQKLDERMAQLEELLERLIEKKERQ